MNKLVAPRVNLSQEQATLESRVDELAAQVAELIESRDLASATIHDMMESIELLKAGHGHTIPMPTSTSDCAPAPVAHVKKAAKVTKKTKKGADEEEGDAEDNTKATRAPNVQAWLCAKITHDDAIYAAFLNGNGQGNTNYWNGNGLGAQAFALKDKKGSKKLPPMTDVGARAAFAKYLMYTVWKAKESKGEEVPFTQEHKDAWKALRKNEAEQHTSTPLPCGTQVDTTNELDTE